MEKKKKKKKKERTDIFSKIDCTLNEKRRKENWTFVNWECYIVLTCCKVKNFWVCLSLKAKLEKKIFFPVHIMKFDENH